MRKILIMILIIILLAAFGILVTSGISLGKFEVKSVEELIQDNKNLDAKIAELDKSIKIDYASEQSNLSSSIQNLQAAKQKYQETINYSTEDEIKAANQTIKYEMSYLWTKIGLYATNNNVTMKADVSASSIADLYNIAFTATGDYISISEFIYAIEKDSKLGFKIEDFTMTQYSEEQLQTTFTIRNVAIDKNSLTESGNVVQSTTNNTNTDQETNQNGQNTITQ